MQPGPVCEWSYIKDSDGPELGEAGKIEMDDDWKAMSTGGWHLVSQQTGYYIFERCR